MSENKALLISTCLASFLCTFMGASLNVAMPFIAQDYNCAPEDVTWMINAFTTTSAAFLLSASALADRFGYLKIYLTGVFLSIIFTIAVGLSPNLLTSSLMRGLQGCSFALIFCTSIALVSQRVSKKRHAIAISYVIASVYSGLTFAPPVSGFLVEILSWQSMFFMTGAFLVVAFFLAKRAHYDQPQSTNSLPIYRMSITFVIGLVLLSSLAYYTSDFRMIYVMCFSAVALLFYIMYEFRSQKPLLPIRFILQNKILSYALVASLFHYFGSAVFILLLAMHLQIVLHLSASLTGAILLLQPLVMVITTYISGRLAHVVGVQFLTLCGISLCGASALALTSLTPNSSLFFIICCQVLMGLGFGLFSTPNTVIIMSSVDKTQYALASAVQSISRNVGQGISMALLTAIMHHFIDAMEGTTLYIRELSYAIYIEFSINSCIFIIALISSILCMLYYRKKQKSQSAEQVTNTDLH